MDWHCTEENLSEEEFEVSREWYKTEMISLLACLLFIVLWGWGWGGGERSRVGTGIVVIRIRIAVTYIYSH